MHFKTWVEATVFVSSSTLRGSLTLSAKKVFTFELIVFSFKFTLYMFPFDWWHDYLWESEISFSDIINIFWKCIPLCESVEMTVCRQIFISTLRQITKKKQFKLSGGKSIRCKSIISFHLFRWKNIKPTTCGAESPWKRMTAHMHIYEMFDMLFSSSSSICHF